MREDVESALKEFGIKTFGNKKNLERAEKLLKDNEKVLFITPTNAVIHEVNTKKKSKVPGIFILTDKRVLFNYKALAVEEIEAFELSDIQNVDFAANSMSGGHIAMHTLTKTLEILVTYKKDTAKKIHDVICKAIDDYKNADKASSSGQGDYLEQIEKLHDLFKQGIITQEEFEAKKKQLLNL